MTNRSVIKIETKNMSPRTVEQFDSIRQKKKKLILDTALELFAENGFHATSISQITKKAGISKGLVYNYFESKQDMLDEIISEGFDTIFVNFDLNHDGILTEEEFIYFINKAFTIMSENLRYWKLYFALMLQPKVSETFTGDYIKKGEPMFQMMYNYIKSKGSIDPEGDLMVISAMIEGAFLYSLSIPDMFPVDILREKIIAAIPRLINNQSPKP